MYSTMYIIQCPVYNSNISKEYFKYRRYFLSSHTICCMTTKKVYKTCAINVPLFRIEVILCSGQLTIQECVVYKLVYPSTNIFISMRTANVRIFKSPFSEYLSFFSKCFRGIIILLYSRNRLNQEPLYLVKCAVKRVKKVYAPMQGLQLIFGVICTLTFSRVAY
jgi:hypothetical protein